MGRVALDDVAAAGHVLTMKRIPPTIDMLPDGTFRTAPPRAGVPFSIKLGIGATLVAVVGIALTVAALAVYLVSLILPVIVIAGVVAWGVVKYRGWQFRRGTARPMARGGLRF